MSAAALPPAQHGGGSGVVSYIVTIILVWVICAAVASAVAPPGRQLEFFFLSLLIIGPLGVGFAAVAMPREPVTVMPGRKRVVCPRCVAAQYIGNGVEVFTCWRCDQHVVVDDGRSVKAASKPKATGPTVRGHEILPIGGHLVPRWWPSISPVAAGYFPGVLRAAGADAR
jgi:hypothetical protein